MPWGVAGAIAGSLMSLRQSQQNHVASLRAQGKDDEADILEAKYSAAFSDLVGGVRSPNHRDVFLHGFKPHIRVRVWLPTPALMRERDWWPWMVAIFWYQLWWLAQ